MENKTLSQQICELCGMKPRYKYIVKGQSTELTVDKDWLIWKFKDRKNKSVFKVIKVIKTYPNFENPENFVKLMELKPLKTHPTLFYEVTSLCYFFNKNSFVVQARTDFLRMLINMLNGYSDDFIRKSSQERLKQSIRDYDGWVWG